MRDSNISINNSNIAISGDNISIGNIDIPLFLANQSAARLEFLTTTFVFPVRAATLLQKYAKPVFFRSIVLSATVKLSFLMAMLLSLTGILLSVTVMSRL